MAAVDRVGRPGYGQAEHGECGSGERRGGGAEARGQGEPADPRAARVGEVERGLVGGGGQRRGRGRLLHDHQLERGAGDEGGRAEQGDGERGTPLGRHQDGEEREDRDQGRETAEEGAAQGMVRQPSARQVARRRADAEQREQQRDAGLGVPGGLGEHRRDVAVRGEQRAEARHRRPQRQPDGQGAQGRQFAAQTAARGLGVVVRDEQRQCGDRGQPDQADPEEGDPPAEVLADGGGDRHSGDVRDGQPEEHQRDGACLALGRDQAGGDDGADTEEGAVRQAAEEAGGEQPVLVGGEGGERVARDEEDHEADQDLAAGQAGGGRGEQRGADHHAERVRRDQVAGGGEGYVEVVRDVGQQAHHHELGGADAEGAHGEGEQGQGHEGAFRGSGAMERGGARNGPACRGSAGRHTDGPADGPVPCARTRPCTSMCTGFVSSAMEQTLSGPVFRQVKNRLPRPSRGRRSGDGRCWSRAASRRSPARRP